MDYLKTQAPFWKQEQLADGTRRWGLAARQSDNRGINKREIENQRTQNDSNKSSHTQLIDFIVNSIFLVRFRYLGNAPSHTPPPCLPASSQSMTVSKVEIAAIDRDFVRGRRLCP